MSPARRMSRWRRLLLLCVAVVTGLVGVLPAAERASASTDAAAFEAVAPCRLLDTRRSGSPVAAGRTVVIDVAGACGVPVDAVAAAITVTVVDPSGPGHVTVHPAGGSVPLAATLTYRDGDVVSASQIARLGDGGISIVSVARTDLVVDVTGAFVPTDGEAAAGRFVVDGPRRVTDTRGSSRPRRDGIVRVDPGVPVDAIAVAVNITTTATAGPDHLTAYPAGSTRPLAAVLTVDRAGQTRGAGTIVPVGSDGFDVYTKNGSHVIVDLLGYFTGPSAGTSPDGLYVPAEPTRLVDTRRPYGPTGGPRLWDSGARAFDPTSVTGGPVAAVAATVTMTATEDAGYVSLYAAGDVRPTAAAVNADRAQQTVANFAIAPASTDGIAASTRHGTHLVIDVGGWFTGSPSPSAGVPAVNAPPPPRTVTIISDSALAGMRWNGALAGLQGFVARPLLESCRRLVQRSCRGREGYAPATAREEIMALPAAGPEEILVVATGYNDWHEGFAADFDAIVGAARSRGFRHISWLTYRSHVGYVLPGSGGAQSNYGAMNAVIAAKVASGSFPEVRVWDYDRYTLGAAGWFTSDGIHLTGLGGWGVADYLSRQVRAFDEVACAQPWQPGSAVLDPCPDPDVAVATLGHPDVATLYGL